MKPLTLLIATVLLGGCVTVNPEPVDVTAKGCHLSGVATSQQHEGMTPVVLEVSTTVGGVYRFCGDNGRDMTLGCIRRTEGGWAIYHSGRESRYHEWCHAKYGPKHRIYYMGAGR